MIKALNRRDSTSDQSLVTSFVYWVFMLLMAVFRLLLTGQLWPSIVALLEHTASFWFDGIGVPAVLL